jgi:hypothetical protein
MSVFAFLDVPTGIAQHLVTGLASAVHPLLGVSATAAAIVVFTLLVRLALHPCPAPGCAANGPAPDSRRSSRS